jgi:tagaturonate reductase
MSGPASETILQFGTGKFLRGFVDLFIHELSETQSARDRIVMVQSTGTQRAEIFNRQEGRYHVTIRGLEGGRKVDRTLVVQSVSRALAAKTAWLEILEVARGDALATIVSNATEAGYTLDEDESPRDSPPRSFPAKLLSVLQTRFHAGRPGVTVLPCELLESNGSRLLGLTLSLADRWELPATFKSWLQNECSWRNTLVDRIVSSPSADEPLASTDPLFAVAEPFALWLIEGPAVGLPLAAHPAVSQVADLVPYHLRKVRILNGAHTALVAKALPMGIQTVRDAVEDDRIRPWLNSLLFEEIVPVLEGRTDQPEEFARATLERLANPYLDHRLADIALHHEVKLQTRLAPTRQEYRDRFGRDPKILSRILARSV